ACATTRFALSREYVPTTPTESAWTPGMESLPLSEVATGIESFSARATRSLPAPDARTPPPATMTGRSASWRILSAARTLPSSGSGRNGGTRANCCSTSGSMSASSASTCPSLPRNCRCTGAGVAVGHVGRGFLAVGVDALDLRAALHLGEGPAQYGRNHEDVGDAVAGEHVGEALGTGDFCHGYLIARGLVGEPTAPVIGIAGATNRNSYTLSAAQSSASSFT